MSVRPHGKTRFPINGFLLNLILSIFRKSVAEILPSLEPGKNGGYFTWRPTHIFDNNSLSSP